MCVPNNCKRLKIIKKLGGLCAELVSQMSYILAPLSKLEITDSAFQGQFMREGKPVSPISRFIFKENDLAIQQKFSE